MFCWFLSGCQNTPARGSRYCSEHVDIATTFRDDECSTSTKSPDEIDTVIVKIVNEKNTRQGKYFEVLYLHDKRSYVHNANSLGKATQQNYLQIEFQIIRMLEFQQGTVNNLPKTCKRDIVKGILHL